MTELPIALIILMKSVVVVVLMSLPVSLTKLVFHRQVAVTDSETVKMAVMNSTVHVWIVSSLVTLMGNACPGQDAVMDDKTVRMAATKTIVHEPL